MFMQNDARTCADECQESGKLGDAPFTAGNPHHPFDTLPCHIEEGPPTVAAIVVGCVLLVFAIAAGLAVWAVL